jgi:homoserine kinase
MMQTISVRVPCSTSNLGAGFDCIGLAFDRYLTATLHIADQPLHIERRGTLQDANISNRDDWLLAAMHSLDCHPRGLLVVDSDIPVGKGLGSSGAAAVAGVMLAIRLKRSEMRRQDVASHAAGIEGHPDNAVPATFGGLVAAMAESSDSAMMVRIHRLPLSSLLRFVYAAPRVALATKDARDALPGNVSHEVAARAIARSLALVEGLREADPELLRIGFADELHVPYRLPMIPGGQEVMNAAVEAGAHCATISGAGSGMIAVCPRGGENEVMYAMQKTFERCTGEDAIAALLEPDLHGAEYIEA